MTSQTIEITPGQEPEVIEQLLDMARKMKGPDEPGDITTVADIIHKGDGEFPAPIVAQVMKTAQYCYIYAKKTGDRRITNLNMLPAQLKKLDESGEPFFTVFDPGIRPEVGTQKCLLHPDMPERAAHNLMGLPTCKKSNFPNVYQVHSHMQNKHSKAWKTLEDERLRRERLEDREAQRALYQAVGGTAQNAIQHEKDQDGGIFDRDAIDLVQTEVANPQVAPTGNPEAAPKVQAAERSTTLGKYLANGKCDICGKPFGAKTAGSVKTKITIHEKKEHPSEEG